MAEIVQPDTTTEINGLTGNVTLAAGTNITLGTVGNTITINSSGGGGMAIGGSITSATQGSILFAGASGVLAQNNANFFWDNTNNRLGIGTATPNNGIQVNGLIDFDPTLNNTFLGAAAGNTGTYGGNNVAVGALALTGNTYGQGNVAIGYLSLANNTSGNYNVAIGAVSLFNNTTGSSNCAVGYGIMRNNTTGGANSAFGIGALYNNTTGSYNCAYGNNSLTANSSGGDDTAYGNTSLQYNTTGNQNSAFGSNSLTQNTSGNFNSAFGFNSLNQNTTGGGNSTLGWQSLYLITTGYGNVAVGYMAGQYVTGSVANQTSNNSVYLGSQTYGYADGDTNEIVIGAQAVGSGSNTATLGNTSITATYLNGTVYTTGPVTLKNYTVSTLPSGTRGQIAYVTDALTPVWGATVVGGGSVVTLVFYNGSSWTVR